MKWVVYGVVAVGLATAGITLAASRGPEPIPVDIEGCCLKDGKCEKATSDKGCDRGTYFVLGTCISETKCEAL